MRRRAFIERVAALGVAWPLAARAQQRESVRRIGVLMNRAASDPQGQGRVAAFKQRMQQLGWSDGRNVQIDVRWGEDDFDLEQKNAAQLIALGPDIIFASGTLSVADYGVSTAQYRSSLPMSPTRSALVSSTA
jgi:putative ABC transport system substrate-binding protein